MTQVNFSGSGTDDIESQVGKGKGLQVGTTKIDFASGKIQLNDNVSIGNFRTLKKKGSDSNTVKSFSFKSTTKCVIKYQDTFIDYNLINEWLILQGIQTEEISISRTATGVTPDIFDFNFIASDDVNNKISIEKGTRDSDLETIFPLLSRVANTYTQTINVQGAKKIILTGKQTAETGTVDISAEIFDPASGDWLELIPTADIFSLSNGQSKVKQIGDSISRKPTLDEARYYEYLGSGASPWTVQEKTPVTSYGSGFIPFGLLGTFIGYVLPSGDSVLRIKAVVNTNPATFSIGALKVFN